MQLIYHYAKDLMGDFSASSENRVLHRRSFDIIAANLNEFEFKRDFSIYLIFLSPTGRTFSQTADK